MVESGLDRMIIDQGIISLFQHELLLHKVYSILVVTCLLCFSYLIPSWSLNNHFATEEWNGCQTMDALTIPILQRSIKANVSFTEAFLHSSSEKYLGERKKVYRCEWVGVYLFFLEIWVQMLEVVNKLVYLAVTVFGQNVCLYHMRLW